MSVLLDTDTTVKEGHETSPEVLSPPFSQATVRSARCGKSRATDFIKVLRQNDADLYTSLTLAGLERRKLIFTDYTGCIIVDDLGSEKSLWSRTATVAVLANLVETHFVQKVTQGQDIGITDFHGSAILNIQPILMRSILQTDEWIAVTRDKSLRYYHLFRPLDPIDAMPRAYIDWGESHKAVKMTGQNKKLWNELIGLTLSQWSFGRCKRHVPALLRASAALDGRQKVNKSDYKLLLKLLKPMQLERDIVTTYGFEEGRNFLNNTYCILVQIASYKEPTIANFAIDFKCSPSTVERLVASAPDWCYVVGEGNRRVLPKEQTVKILDMVGVNDKW